jgi:hypothetical protein
MAWGWFRRSLCVGLIGLLPTGVLCLSAGPACAEEIIFLQDGHTLQANKTEVIGDRVRFERPSGKIVDLPKSDVLSIHHLTPPKATPATPPAAVYHDLTGQMNNEVRQQIQQQKSLAPPPRF